MSHNSKRKKKKKPKIKKFRTLYSSEKFVDRELAWLEFNKRVLEQAADANVPLLERAKFLSIFHSNLDEFFMKRVGPRRYVDRAEGGHSFSNIRKVVLKDYEKMDQLCQKDIKPFLHKKGIEILTWNEIDKKDKLDLEKQFNEKIFPVLTPLSVDPAHPFPYLSNLSTSIAVALKYPNHPERYFSRIKISKFFPAFVLISTIGKIQKFIKLEDLVVNFLDKLFPGMQIVDTMIVRVTRNIELESEESQTSNILEQVERELKDRRYGEVVKLEHSPSKDPWLLKFLMTELELDVNDLYELKHDIDFTVYKEISQLYHPELKDKGWNPVIPKGLDQDVTGFFSTISRKDILLHHPFDSFTASVERFLHLASEDPKVLAIKMTLYRTNQDSSIIRSLMKAAEKGKQVACIVELTARFDEENNISWANSLEDAGVHIAYGLVGLKTHSKIALVVRQESDGIKSYAHIGSGNYHSITAKNYTDFGLLTADPKITKELIEVFHYLTGRNLKKDYKFLLVSPVNTKSKILELIKNETQFAKEKKPAHIIFKCNNLEDHEICDQLFKASEAGVKVDLIIRSICTLRPDIKGLSENINVYSIIDRYLEHSRVYYFRNNQSNPSLGEFYFGSADLMYRNLIGRVEVLAPLLSINIKQKMYNILKTYLSDQVQCWKMQMDGSYKRLHPGDKNAISAQNNFLKNAKENS